MARPLRIQFADASYHIFSRGNRRELIFKSDSDYKAFEFFLLQAAEQCRVELFDWSQMPNHFHFNIATPEANIGQFMQRLMTRYAKYFNATHQLVGHVYQGRYGSRLVDTEVYFQEII